MYDKYHFPKTFRLLGRFQFQETLGNKKSLLGKYYVCYYHPNKLAYSRLGIITAKKKCPLAVLRNRIKRQVRESFRHYHSRLPGYDIVVIARQSAREASKCELRQCLDDSFSNLIKELIG